MTLLARFGRAAAAGLMLAALLAGLAWYDGLWGSLEHRVEVAVRKVGSCADVETDRSGLGGRDHDAINRSASRRFVATCEMLGPMAAVYVFDRLSDLVHALRSTRVSPFTSLCVSSSERTVLLTDDVPRRDALCDSIDGRLVRRERSAR